jgi:CTP:molybdopterin cytidylyltransferase MocA
MRVTGVVVAAGGGSRFGAPKALVVSDGQAWVARAARTLLAGGCDDVVVVLGASALEAAALVPPDASISTVVNPRWQSGMASSVAAGLAAATGDAAVVTLVDLPGLPAAAVARVLAEASGPLSLARAVYASEPGHPVLVGRGHWAALAATLHGDRGASAYLAENGAVEVECGDLFDGHDVDRAGDS